MWNYTFVVPNISLLITFLIFYFLQPHIPISKNRAFLRILTIEIFIILLDIIASRALEEYNSYPLFFHLIFNVLFFAAFFTRSAFFFHFNYVLVTPKPERTIKNLLLTYSVFIICILVALANFFTPTLFILDDSGYHRFKFYNILYICSFFYVGVSLLVLIINRRKLRKNLFISAITFNTILFAGYTIRLMFPHYLIMDFFCMLAIIIMYLSFEDSAVYIESRTQAFRLEALSLLIEELLGRQPFILGIQIHNYNDMREIYTGPRIDDALGLIASFLKKTYPGLSCFYINSGRFVMIGDTSEYDFEIEKEHIRERFKKPWKNPGIDMEVYLDVHFMEVCQHLNVDNAENLLQGILSAFNNISELSDADMVISEETLDNIKKVTDVKRIVQKAVENKNVEMFLQPIVSAKNHKLVGAEALARIRDSYGNIISPGIFIPIAEKTGLINRLGEQMLEKTCNFMNTHKIEELGLSWINVNLSPLQFLKRDLSKRFTSIIEKYQVDPEKIHLEITEEAMIDYALLKKQVFDIKNAGFEFVLDDFGAGYSNVTRLNKYPFVNIKFDMQVVWEYFNTKEEILPALVQAFKHSGFTVTAEGIESKAMAKGMEELGCDYLQGFYFSQPLPVDEFIKKYGKK
ncbi:EAL domain-containing protein [Treponema sp. C6A8]|uniref:EAL domain-containing protein n=1 Tax=Treponema sp. C6A8 TaxID=1410609 RepID=UPI00047F900D|nr:EAL domain-containing protein [Treponema sp. C6A8]